MPPETAKLLLDMKSAADRIARFAAGKGFADYVADELLRSAVERQFAIIGEAMVRLIKHDRATAESITDFRKIAGFRHVLIHGDDAIDDETSWSIVSEKLPILRDELERLISGQVQK
jgi:uncharacterized protein with HEPN domain